MGKKRLTNDEFIKKANKIHNNKYMYGKSEYINCDTKICITCPIHGDFWQTPYHHLNGHGCPKCGKKTTALKLSFTSDDFIKKSKSVHGNKYNYSLVKYKNNRTNVCIICPIHGEFWQTPDSHLSGKGCPKCGIEKRREKQFYNNDDFIKKAKIVHKGKHYDYSKVNYIDSSTKVCIICPIHGEFWQVPSQHLQGYGCPYCGGTKKLTNEEFIRRASSIHEFKYDYSKIRYKNGNTKVCIICPEHGEFWQTPKEHLAGHGCPKCYGNDKLTTDEFIKIAEQKHNNKYDYSKSEYKNNHTKVCIICPKHGEFLQLPYVHLQGHGCPECAKMYNAKIRSSNTEEFIKKAAEVHHNKYDYSKVKYVNNHTKICIICPEHGEFWQKPNSHLHGCGCPKCRMSRLEYKTEMQLKQHNIKYEAQKRFKWLIGCKGGQMSIDFFLPEYNTAIECQGIQHYMNQGRGYFTKDKLSEIKQRDILKKQLCEQHGLRIHYINYNDNVEENINKLLNNIVSNGQQKLVK